MDRLRLYSTTKGNFHPRWDYPRFLHQFSPNITRSDQSASAWRYARKRAERNPETIPIMNKYLYERKCIEFALGSGAPTPHSNLLWRQWVWQNDNGYFNIWRMPNYVFMRNSILTFCACLLFLINTFNYSNRLGCILREYCSSKWDHSMTQLLYSLLPVSS